MTSWRGECGPIRRARRRAAGTAAARVACLLTGLSLLCALQARAANWRSATEQELRAVIPARAPVLSERIETEFPTASGITDGHGRFVAGVVLITAGYSAEGKYSHYFVSQATLKMRSFTLPPGQYILGWTHADKTPEETLIVTFYEALTGRRVGSVPAVRNLSSTRVTSFRISPPSERPLIQIGRFTFDYAIAGGGAAGGAAEERSK